MIRRAATAAIAAIAAVTAAAAEPPPRVDADLAAEAKSAFWDEAVHPGSSTNRVRLDDALRHLRLPTGDRKQAAELLTLVTVTAPDDPDGWGYLAIAAEVLRRWPVCAEAYAKTRALAPTWRATRLIDGRTSPRDAKLRPLPQSIALCQARAGAVGDAVRTLADAVARGEATPGLWRTTGELAMIQGRLDDAIAAFGRAGTDASARWQLAIAHDRARHDDRAQAAAALAHDADKHARDASNQALSGLVPADADYLLGFASLTAGRPEEALAHFRRYRASAPAAPWGARAGEHLAALAHVDLVARVSIDGALAAAEQRALATAVRAAQPALLACVAGVPTGLQQLKLVRRGAGESKPSPFQRPGLTVVPSSRNPFDRRTSGTGPRPRPATPARPAPPPRPAPAIVIPASTTIAASSTIAPIAREQVALVEVHACLERVGATIALPAVGPGGELEVRIPVIPR